MFISEETLKKLLEENTKENTKFIYEPGEIVKALFNEHSIEDIKFKERHLKNVEENISLFPNINNYLKKEN
jgi:hypothetical protein